MAALVRLGALADDAQRAVTAWADELALHHARQTATGWQLNCAELPGKPPHVVAELLICLWKKSGWPRQAMNLATWQRLACMALADDSPAAAEMFPGTITAQRVGPYLLLNRPQAAGE